MWRDIPDDPIIACILSTGYPPWMQDEDDDYVEPMAVYEGDGD